MELTTAELEALLSVSRSQISRYAKDGRLTRTRPGHYAAASVANLERPFFSVYVWRENVQKERAEWLAEREAEFRAYLHCVIAARHRERGIDENLTDAEAGEIAEAVSGFTDILAGLAHN